MAALILKSIPNAFIIILCGHLLMEFFGAGLYESFAIFEDFRKLGQVMHVERDGFLIIT